MKSWEIYNIARKALGTGICKIYGNRNARTIDYWAQDPACSADHKRNPIDRLGALLAKLDSIGERDTAKSALRLLAGAINCRVIDRVELEPRRALYVVRVGQQAFLIGAAEGGIRKLAEIDADELPEGQPVPSAFAKLLRKKVEKEENNAGE